MPNPNGFGLVDIPAPTSVEGSTTDILLYDSTGSAHHCETAPEPVTCLFSYAIVREILGTDDFRNMYIQLIVQGGNVGFGLGESVIEVDLARDLEIVLPASRIQAKLHYGLSPFLQQSTAPALKVSSYAAVGAKSSSTGSSAVARRTIYAVGGTTATQFIRIPAFARSIEVLTSDATKYTTLLLNQRCGPNGVIISQTPCTFKDGDAIPVVNGAQFVDVEDSADPPFSGVFAFVFNLAF